MSDRILGAVCVVAGAGMAWAAHDYAAPISYEPVGPRAFPLLLAGLMALAGAWLLLRPGGAGFDLGHEHFKPISLAVLAVFVYAGLFQTLGFPLATAAMALPVGMAFGGSWKQSLAGGVVLGLLLYLMFDKLLDVVLPTGLLSFIFGGTLMETLQFLLGGFAVALSPENLMVAAIGAFIGTIVGMLPGLGPINGVAILMPLAFALKLPPETALILLAAVYMGCEYGGRISSILLNVPGDAGAIMTALDGHPMAKQGLAGVALSISAWSSFVGSLIATIGIVLFAPLLARWALAFGPAEYFALMCFAFACITGLMGDAPMKAALAAVIGLSLSTVGLDSNSGVYRFTGGNVHLSDGIQFIVVVIGVFSVSEILLMLEQHHASGGLIQISGRKLFNLKELMHTGWGTLRSAVVGFVVGVLPGAGATIASAMTYSMEKRIAGASGRFGEGDIRGVSAPEAANNASAAGSFVPMLTLGVPGSGTTAVMVGALSLYNITPGPALFTQNPTLVWGLIASLFIANVMLLLINIPMVGVFTKVLQLPNWVLVPGILAVSAVGVYSVHATTFDLMMMAGLGVAGYLLRKQGVPMAPLILGFVLGDLMEQNLRRALSMTNGELGILVESPISIGLWIGAAAMLVVPPLMRLLASRKSAAAAA